MQLLILTKLYQVMGVFFKFCDAVRIQHLPIDINSGELFTQHFDALQPGLCSDESLQSKVIKCLFKIRLDLA